MMGSCLCGCEVGNECWSNEGPLVKLVLTGLRVRSATTGIPNGLT